LPRKQSPAHRPWLEYARDGADLFRDRFTEWAGHWVEEGKAAIEGAGLLIGVGNSTLLAQALAEAHGLQFVGAQLQPLTPSRHMPPMVLAGVSSRLPGAMNMGIYHLLRLLVWQVMRPAINGIVRPQLGLRGFPWYGPYFNAGGSRGRVIYGFSPQILPVRRIGRRRHRLPVTGF